MRFRDYIKAFIPVRQYSITLFNSFGDLIDYMTYHRIHTFKEKEYSFLRSEQS